MANIGKLDSCDTCHYFVALNNFKPVIILNLGEEKARPVCRHQSACPTGPCRRGGWAWRPSKPPEGRGEGWWGRGEEGRWLWKGGTAFLPLNPEYSTTYPQREVAVTNSRDKPSWLVTCSVWNVNWQPTALALAFSVQRESVSDLVSEWVSEWLSDWARVRASPQSVPVA